MKQTILFVALAVFLWACAQTVPPTWTSIPPIHRISKTSYTIQVEPLKRDTPYYVSFLLTIQNHGDKALVVDWNDSRYLHKGEDLGVFVFRGIDPGTIKSGIPADTIPAGESLSKEIFPFRTIAFVPRSKLSASDRLGFEPGALPGGDNTLQLALRRGKDQWQVSFMLRLIAEERK